MPRAYAKVPAGMYRGRRLDDLTLDQLALLRREVLAAISRKQGAAGDTGPVVVGAALAVGEVEFIARRWAESMRLTWPRGPQALIDDDQERLRRLLLVECVDEQGEVCDRTGACGGWGDEEEQAEATR